MSLASGADVVRQHSGAHVAPGEQTMSATRPPEHANRDPRPPVLAGSMGARSAGDPGPGPAGQSSDQLVDAGAAHVGGDQVLLTKTDQGGRWDLATLVTRLT